MLVTKNRHIGIRRRNQKKSEESEEEHKNEPLHLLSIGFERGIKIIQWKDKVFSISSAGILIKYPYTYK